MATLLPKRKIFFFSFCFILTQMSFSQEKVQPLGYNYYGERVNEKAICNQFFNFKTKEIATKAVDEIVRRSGLRRNFYVMECPNTDNCFAAVQGSTRLIVYDGAFMQKANNLAKNDWGALSILAHEIGHHLQGHTIMPGGSDPQKELEADEFSGFVLYQMGATVKEAQAAISKLTSDYDGGTHPPRNKRLASIEKGWKNAQELYPNVKKTDSNILTGGTSKTDSPNTPSPTKYPPTTKTGTTEKDNVENPVDKSTTSTEKPSNSDTEAKKSTNLPVENSSKKVGCVDGNCSEGIGKMVNPKTEEIYFGEWKNGKREGRGTEFYADGSKKYIGNFMQGKYFGNGTFYFRNGDTYVGKFRNGLMNDDRGYFIYANNSRLVAKVVDGKKNGKAMRIYQDGRRQETYFENDIEK